MRRLESESKTCGEIALPGALAGQAKSELTWEIVK